MEHLFLREAWREGSLRDILSKALEMGVFPQGLTFGEH